MNKNEIVLYLYCELKEQESNSALVVFPSEKQHLSFKPDEWVAKNGFLFLVKIDPFGSLRYSV